MEEEVHHSEPVAFWFKFQNTRKAHEHEDYKSLMGCDRRLYDGSVFRSVLPTRLTGCATRAEYEGRADQY